MRVASGIETPDGREDDAGFMREPGFAEEPARPSAKGLAKEIEQAFIRHLRNVEAHEVRRRLRDAEDVAGRKDEAFHHCCPCEVRRIGIVRQPAPQEHAGLRHQPRLHADLP